nr:hypothetical protein BaRGS_017173 [Batillaria attramentaria]
MNTSASPFQVLQNLSADNSTPSDLDSTSNVTSLPAEEQECLRLYIAAILARERKDEGSIVSWRTADIVTRVTLVVSAVVVVQGLVGNVINMVIFRRMGLKERVNICLFWLALADFMSLVLHAMLYGHHTIQVLQGAPRLVNGEWMKIVFNYKLLTISGFRYVSFFMWALVATERCICIAYPLLAKRLLRNSTTLTAVVVGSLVSFGIQMFCNLQYKMRCVEIIDTGEREYMVQHSNAYLAHRTLFDVMISVVQGVAMPPLLMGVVILTTSITVISLRRSSHQVAVSKMLVLVSWVYVTCTLPIFVHKVLFLAWPGYQVGGRHQLLCKLNYMLCNLLMNINCSVNTLAYYRHGSRYRHHFRNIFSRNSTRQRHRYRVCSGTEMVTPAKFLK